MTEAPFSGHTETQLGPIFKEWFGVNPSAGRVAAALYCACGTVASRSSLMEAARQTEGGLAYTIKMLRQAMDPGSIECLHGVGWRLTQVGLNDCAAAIVDAEARAAA
jgi:hypothetical protein